MEGSVNAYVAFTIHYDDNGEEKELKVPYGHAVPRVGEIIKLTPKKSKTSQLFRVTQIVHEVRPRFFGDDQKIKVYVSRIQEK